MPSKFPVWIYGVLALQLLLALVLCAFLLVMGNAYSGGSPLNLMTLIVLLALLLPPLLCLWSARRQWEAGRSTAAKLLAFAPVLLILGIGALAELVMA